MNKGMIAGIICVFLLLSLAGFSIADEAPGYTLYLQGGDSFITSDTDGVKVISIQDVVPYICVEFEKTKQLLPVDDAPIFPFPMNAVLVFSGTDGDSFSLVQVSNLSLSDENKVLTLQIKPRDFYEGELLKAIAKGAVPIDTVDQEKKDITSVYLEVASIAPENSSEECRECLAWCSSFENPKVHCAYYCGGC